MNEFKPKLLPAFPTHPGKFLREELDARGMTGADLARAADLPVAVVDDIVSEREIITELVARKIALALDTSCEGWANLTTLYQLTLERDAEREAAKAQT